MACDYDNEWKCGDGENSLLKKILGRLKELVGLADPPGGGSTVTLTVSDIEIGAVEIKDGDTDARAKVITTCPLDSDRGLVVRNIPCGTQAISVTSLPLPAGAATELTLLNFLPTLDTIHDLLNARLVQGITTMQFSLSVTIASDQPPIPVTGNFSLTGGTFMTTCPVGTESGLIVRAVPCGTQAVSVSSLPLPAGAATEATLSLLQGNVIFYLPSIDNYLANIFSLIRTTCPSGADAALAVRNIPCGTQAISAVSLPLPAGAATEVTLANIDVFTSFFLPDIASSLVELTFTRTPTLGQKTMAGSSPVVIASDQSAIPVTFGTFMTTCPVGTESGLIVRAVPCGTQAISATQLPAALVGARLDTNIGAWLGSTAPTVGQKTMAASLPVVIASDQSVISMQFGRAATYGCLTAELTLGTAIGKNRILSLFHPVGVTLTYEIMKVILFFKATHTVGVGQYKITFTTVESATGTVLTPQQYRRSDANTGASVRAATTADGTLTGNPFIGYTKSLTPITGDPLGGMVPIYEHNAAEAPITLRASTAEGILVYQDVTATLTTAPIVACRIVWREIV